MNLSALPYRLQQRPLKYKTIFQNCPKIGFWCSLGGLRAAKTIFINAETLDRDISKGVL